MLNELTCNFIACSHLTRSIHSAKIIGYPSPHLVDAIFREAELPKIHIPVLRLTPQAWCTVFRLRWFEGVSTKAEPMEAFKQRTTMAANK